MGRKRPLRSSCAATAAEPVACTKLWPVDRGGGMEKKSWRGLALLLSLLLFVGVVVVCWRCLLALWLLVGVVVVCCCCLLALLLLVGVVAVCCGCLLALLLLVGVVVVVVCWRWCCHFFVVCWRCRCCLLFVGEGEGPSSLKCPVKR